jgi:hypothetical protein|tara:strand:+ start:886 stop:1086 length:201 start_codon:yes stop_codon:yes gene_type:complete
MPTASTTHVAKIVIGTPIRRVVGASVQELNDLSNVTITNAQDGDILQFEAASNKFVNKGQLSGGTY